MQDDHLGLFMEQRPFADSGDAQGDAVSEGYSPSIGEDPQPEEPPVDVQRKVNHFLKIVLWNSLMTNRLLQLMVL